MAEEKTDGNFEDSNRTVVVADEQIRNETDDGGSSCAVEIAAINADVKKLRTFCGCLVFLLAVVTLLALYPFYCAKKVAEKTVDAAALTVKSAMDAVVAVANSQPSVEVVMSASYVGTWAENKFVAASVDEKVNLSAEFSKLKFLTATIKIGVLAHYQYYIPLRGWKVDVRKLPSSDKCDFTFYFDTLSLDTPVKYDELYRETDKSKFSGDANKKLAEFQRAEFPKMLVEKGMGAGNMRLAADGARKTAENFVRGYFFSRGGIDPRAVGRIEIIFDTNAFDNFRAGMKILDNEKRK